MKSTKVIAAGLAAVVSLGSFQMLSGSLCSANAASFDITTASETLTLGDVDGNGVVNAADASDVLKEYSCLSTGNPSIFTSEQTAAGDVDKNGAVNADDASLILGYYAHVQSGGSMTFAEFLKRNVVQQPSVTTQPPVTTVNSTATTAKHPVTTVNTPATTAKPPVTTVNTPATTAKPPVTTAKTPATTAKPPVTTAKTPATTAKPPVTTVNTPATTAKPPVTTVNTPATTAKPSVTTAKTPATTAKPPVTTVNTPATTAKPLVTTINTPATTAKSLVTTQPPVTTIVTTTAQITTSTAITTTAPVTTEAAAHVSAIKLSYVASTIRLGEGILAAKVEMLPANAADKSEIWSSDNEKVAVVNGEGWISAVGEGDCTITVKSADNPEVKADIKISVVDPKNVKQIVLDRTSMNMEVGTGELSATVKMLPELAYDKREIWSSSDESVAYSDSEGYVIAVAPGKCVITVQSACNPDVKAQINVTVYPKGGMPSDLPDKISEIKLSVSEIELKVGEKGISYVTMLPDSVENKNEIWTSSDESVAIVDMFGNITALKEGKCTITVTSEDNPDVSADIAVTVTDQNKVTAIRLSKTELIIPLGSYDISYVTMLPETAVNKNEIWVSSDETIASVDIYGNVYAKRLGECTVTVYSQDNPNVKAEISVKVVDSEEPPAEHLYSSIVEELSTDSTIAFETILPEKASGRFVIDYIITDSNGITTSVSSSTLLLPDMGTVRTFLTAGTSEFIVKAYLTNLGTNKSSVIGFYRINRENGTLKIENEDIMDAFERVGGINKT